MAPQTVTNPATYGVAAQRRNKRKKVAAVISKNQNESCPSPPSIETVEKKFRQPLVGYPRLSASRVGERIGVWNRLVRDDVLPGLEVPP